MVYIQKEGLALKIFVIPLVTVVFLYSSGIEKVKVVDYPIVLENKLNQNETVFNVRKYGAKGNGIHDDTAKIRDAIQAAVATGGGTVFFEKGTYLITGVINVPKNVSILGAGKSVTTLKRSDQKDERILSLLGDQTVKDIGFDSRIGVLPMGDDITILDSKFECRVQGIQNTATVYRLSVINVLFYNCGYGILSNKNPSLDVKVMNCRFLNTKADGIEINVNSQRWLIENCIFDRNTSESSWSGFGVGIAVAAKDIVIKNSSFNNIIGQGVHVEDYAEVTIMNSSFKNCGSEKYAGSPKADIAVLSNAVVTVIDSTFYASDKGYSNLAIYSTDKPVGGTVIVKSSKFYNKIVSKQVIVEDSEFIKH